MNFFNPTDMYVRDENGTAVEREEWEREKNIYRKNHSIEKRFK